MTPEERRRLFEFQKKSFEVIFDSVAKTLQRDRRKQQRPPSHEEWAEEQELRPK